ncbi:MAG TPA: hypothetical protein VN436_06015, partial [Holophaga sp.]|nr:hypothetical protein [Holophaga sp.]
QHFRNIPRMNLDMKANGALDAGLVFYSDQRPGGFGDLYIFKIPWSIVKPEEGPIEPLIRAAQI